MITIRYADLPEGLHVHAEAHGRRTVIYLRPGLTAEQRRLSLRRARQSARMGYGPRLTGPGVALAVARHVSAGTLRNLGAAVRRHPIVFVLLSAGFAGLMLSYALFVTVSVRLMLDPAPVHAGARSPLPARVVPATSPPPRGGVTAPGPAVPAWPGPAVPAPRPSHAHHGTPRVAVAHDRRAPGPGPTAQSPAATPSPSPSPSPPNQSVCVAVGPLGVCL